MPKGERYPHTNISGACARVEERLPPFRADDCPRRISRHAKSPENRECVLGDFLGEFGFRFSPSFPFRPGQIHLALRVLRSVAVARNLRRSDQLKVDTGKTGVISVNHRLIMHGDCIPITPGKPDEGIWLEKRRKGKMSMAEILKSDHTAAEFVFHDVVPRGKYFVVIGSRCAKGDDFRVIRARHEVRVV